RHMPAATAAAAPPLDPEGMWSTFQAFRVGGASKPKANSYVVVVPSMTAPASLSFWTTAESAPATWFSRTFEPDRVLTPLTSYSSLIAIGTPCKGPRYLPLLISASAVFADARASSDKTST